MEASAPVEAAAGALKTAALSPCRELLAARRTALGKGARLSAVAGVEGRALSGDAARTGRPAELRGTKVGVLPESLRASCMRAALRCKTLAGGAVCGGMGLPSGASGRDTALGRGSAGRASGTLRGKASVIPAGGSSGRRAAKALAARGVAIGDALPVHRVVLPGVPGDHCAIGVDPVELV
jgi:hypothetical protein